MMTDTKTLADLREQWQRLKSDSVRGADGVTTNPDELHALLQDCIAAGETYAAIPDRVALERLAREIADAIFRFTLEYPDATIRASAISVPLVASRTESPAYGTQRDADGSRAEVCATPEPESGSLTRVDLARLPAGSPDFLNREEDLALLDAAWSGQGPRPSIVVLVAPGGVGKTALVKRWLDRVRTDGWRGAERVFGWSFHSQGTGDDHQASDDNFLGEALTWFGIGHDPAASPWNKGSLLAEAVAARRTLLVLDGCEPLQYPPGPLAGQLRTPGLKALLTQLVGAGQQGLTLLTSREALADLAEYARGPEYPQGSVLIHYLGNLSESDGARLLHRLGSVRAGAAAIDPDDAELRAASREVRGHALTLNLLGRYLMQAEGGDIRRRDTVNLMTAADSLGGHVFRVLAAYETSLERAGQTVELGALRLLGLFDRPADLGCIQALRQAPPVPGLTEPLMDLSQARWNLALSRLAECGLIMRPGPSSPSPGVSAASGSLDLTLPVRTASEVNLSGAGIRYPAGMAGVTMERPAATIDAHPLVREYLGRRLRESCPDAWREGHRRLYEYLKFSVPYHPEGLAGLQPLYQAVGHGCLAGLYQEAFSEVYRDRILRISGRDSFYSITKLGALGSDLGAVARFFDEPWRHPTEALSEGARAWLLNQASFYLRALGRLAEALEPLRAALARDVQAESWRQAAISAGNLSELALALGSVTEAVAVGEQSLEYADRSGDLFVRMSVRAILADAMHQAGQSPAALGLLGEAESLQAQRQPQYPLLYSTQGFRYCELLLAKSECAAWRVSLALPAVEDEGSGRPVERIADSRSVEQRAEQTIQWATGRLLDIALDCLALGRAKLLQVLLSPGGQTQAALAEVGRRLAAAVGGLRAAGQQDELPKGLLSRAWFHALAQDPAAARADLDEAWQIASRGGMKLFMADCHLHRARLFCDRAELARARALIEQCGYWRRREELADAEQAATTWGNDQAGASVSLS